LKTITFTKLTSFFHKSSFVVNTFQLFPQALYAGHVKLFAGALELCLSACHSPQSGVFRMHPWGDHKDGNQRVLGTVGRMRRDFCR